MLLLRYRNITKPNLILLSLAIITLVSSCTLVTDMPAQPTPVAPAPTQTAVPAPPRLRATPYAQSPASGICGYIEGEVVTFTIYPDIPDPRCMQVRPDQSLRVVNQRGEVLHFTIGPFEAEVAPGGEYTFDTPVGEYLAPGVHLLQTSPCCSPELWLMSE